MTKAVYRRITQARLARINSSAEGNSTLKYIGVAADAKNLSKKRREEGCKGDSEGKTHKENGTQH